VTARSRSPHCCRGRGKWRDAIRTCWSSGRSEFDRRLDHKSPMRRKPPVRIREGLGVKLPRATRLVIGAAQEADAQRIMEVLPERMSRYGLTVRSAIARHASQSRRIKPCCTLPLGGVITCAQSERRSREFALRVLRTPG
jgi:hypothetical protein